MRSLTMALLAIPLLGSNVAPVAAKADYWGQKYQYPYTNPYRADWDRYVPPPQSQRPYFRPDPRDYVEPAQRRPYRQDNQSPFYQHCLDNYARYVC